MYKSLFLAVGALFIGTGLAPAQDPVQAPPSDPTPARVPAVQENILSPGVGLQFRY